MNFKITIYSWLILIPILKDLCIFLYMYVGGVFVSDRNMCTNVHEVSMEARRGRCVRGEGITWYECWKPNLDSQQEHQVLLSTQPSFESQITNFKVRMYLNGEQS